MTAPLTLEPVAQALARMCKRPEEARSLAVAARVDLQDVDLSGAPLAVWNRILQRAEAESKLLPLLSTALNGRNPVTQGRPIPPEDRQTLLESYVALAQQALPAATSPREQVELLTGIGEALTDLGEGDRALEAYQKALELYVRTGNHAGEVAMTKQIGRAHLRQDNPDKALEYFEQALDTSRTMGDRAGEARLLNMMAQVYRGQDDRRSALDTYLPGVGGLDRGR